jgi:CO/xanthine dehydrogenase Mo-binding subunit
VHGGLTQGIGQALLEQCVYEPETGQLLSGSLLGVKQLEMPATPQRVWRAMRDARAK